MAIAAMLERLTTLAAAATVDGQTLTARGISVVNVHAATTPAQRTAKAVATAKGAAVFIGLPGMKNATAGTQTKSPTAVVLSMRPTVTVELVDTLANKHPSAWNFVEALIAAIHGQPLTAGSEATAPGRKFFAFEESDFLAADNAGAAKNQVYLYYVLTFAIAG